jgi:transcription elongation factor Elf1
MDNASTIAALDYLCFECPRCRSERIAIEPYRGDYKIACGMCWMRFYAWFNGQMWLTTFVEYIR